MQKDQGFDPSSAKFLEFYALCNEFRLSLRKKYKVEKKLTVCTKMYVFR